MRAPGRAEPLQACRAQEPERVLAALKQAQAARVPEQGRVARPQACRAQVPVPDLAVRARASTASAASAPRSAHR